jgi:4-amino-4-deoxy-L-arabinose transferase-like glycosyltransferase
MLLRRAFPLGDPRLPPRVAAVVAILGMLPVLRFAYHRLQVVQGWEADAIARSVLSGHGYSFPGGKRWLWDQWHGDSSQYFPTAWVDPVYTYLLAGVHWLFGAHAYAVMFALHALCLALVSLCAYHMGRRFGGSWTGTLAVALLALHLHFGIALFGDISNSAVATLAMTAAGLVGIRYFEQPSTRRLIELGLVTGLTVLTAPAAQYYVIALAAALAVYHRKEWPATIARPATFLVLAAVVLAPWTIRNYATFGEFVLVRNGAGQIVWDGTVGLAETFMPGAALSTKPAPWTSSGPRDAVQKMMDKDLRNMIHKYQVAALQASPPPGYDQQNEAQRDQMYLERTKNFVKQHPDVAFQMALAKIEVYIMTFGLYGVALIVFGLLGAIVYIRDARSWPLTLGVLCYCAPFVLIVAYYGRYRAPAEPLVTVLAALGLGVLVTRLIKIFNQRRIAIGQT